MYFGSNRRRIEAYRPVATNIVESILNLKKSVKQCKAGKAYIDNHYSFSNFNRRLKSCLKAARKRKKGMGNPSNSLVLKQGGFAVSPYLRLVDWKRGRFVTDRGIFQSKSKSKFAVQLFRKGKSSKKPIPYNKIDPRIVFPRP